MMETTEKLASQILNLIKGAELREMKKQIFELLERLDTHLPTMTNLQNLFASNPQKLV